MESNLDKAMRESPTLLDRLPTGLHHIPGGVSVFVDCGNIEERWWRSFEQEREDDMRREMEARQRTREIFQELSMPDPDDRDPMLIRIPGLRRVHNHPLLR